MARQRPLSSNPATLSSTLDELDSNQPMVPSFGTRLNAGTDRDVTANVAFQR